MAAVDPEDQAIVLGIVYDGPPEAGKTTSVRALARSFGREVYTPEEREGRTVYFDWLEHTGGRFDGAPIRCQIVSVPGQDQWQYRRAHLLERADVVVFVGDTGASAWPATVARLRDLRERLARRSGPPVGVVFQANRRDSPSAVELELVREQVCSDRVALVESIALDGTGVREAFVFAVRLALDRVREEQRLGTLPAHDIDAKSSVLLEQLLALEKPQEAAEPPRTERSPVWKSALPDEGPSPARASQGLPSHEAPSGLVWPPVEGRILLRDAMRAPAPAPTRLEASGDHTATLANGHRARSAGSASFASVEEGRSTLIAWARLHVSAQALLSKGRCIVLAQGADESCRLWQIVRGEPSLRELFVDGCETMIPRHAARQLASASRLLVEAQALCQLHELSLSCTLDTIGVSDAGGPIYVADFPFAPANAAAPPSPEHVAQELAQLLEHRSSAERAELCRELLSFQRREPLNTHGARIGELLSQLLAT